MLALPVNELGAAMNCRLEFFNQVRTDRVLPKMSKKLLTSLIFPPEHTPALIVNFNNAVFNSVVSRFLYCYVKLFSCAGYLIVIDIYPLLFFNSDKVSAGHVIGKV